MKLVRRARDILHSNRREGRRMLKVAESISAGANWEHA